MADPETDWSRIEIEALRQHLIDMDNVTLRARVHVRNVEGGARFEATSEVGRPIRLALFEVAVDGPIWLVTWARQITA